MADYDSDIPTGSELDERGSLLISLIEAAKKARGRFDTVCGELDRYDGTFLDCLRLSEQNFDPSQAHHARLNKTQQFKRELGAMLMNRNPVWALEAKDGADQRNVMRGKIMARLLNVAVGESDFFYDAQRTLSDALGYGRGVLWFGIDTRKGIPVAIPGEAKDLFIDPDAKSWREVRWIARRRQRSKEELARRYPTKRATIYDEPGDAKRSDESHALSARGLDLVEYFEVYMTTGLWNYKGSALLAPSERARLSNRPRKYVVTKANMRVLHEGDWEIPFHRESGRQAWPCEVLDFYPDPKGMYPQSPLEPGIPWLKSMNEIITGIVVKQRRAARKFVALLRANGVKISRDDEEKLQHGNNLVEFISLHVNPDDGDAPDLRRYIQEFSENYNFAEDLAVYDRFTHEFEKETGLSDFLFFGEAQRQDRSAAATQARERNSRKRVDQMAAVLDEFFSRTGRKMAITARYLLDTEDVRLSLSQDEAASWGELMSVEDIDPEAVIAEYMDQGVSSDVAMAVVRDMMDAAVDFDRFFQETDYKVELGSLQRRTPEEKAAKAEVGMNQGFAAAINGGMPLTATVLFEQWAENALNLPPDKLAIVRQEAAQLAQRLAAQQTAETQAAAAPMAAPALAQTG